MFDREALISACEAHGRVTRVVVAQVLGSAPREVGASMLVWPGGQSGTIGGGQLEYELSKQAIGLTNDRWSRHALGPQMGQCCGGAVEVLCEVFDLQRAKELPGDVIARGPDPMPLSVRRLLRDARGIGNKPKAHMKDGWMIEPVRPVQQDLWIWGAGHVGRAMVDLFQHFEDFRVSWVDTGADRFPDVIPETVDQLIAQNPALLMQHAPQDAHHLILTYSHALDLDLCHAALARGFGSCGLIGSKTKWARFRKRLLELGHTQTGVNRIQCPIGDPSLGKAPHLIALGVLTEFVTPVRASNQEEQA